MATKLQTYSQLADQTAERVASGGESWMRFLDASARLYKYPFTDQLMIYAQRPDATAVASIEIWNDPMHRWVRRGSRGIALIDDTGHIPRLKYVFDVADTEPARENARKPYLWEMREEHEAPVLEALAKTYDGVEGDIGTAFYNIASQLAAEYYDDNAREIGYSAEGSFLEDYEEFNLGVAFRETLTASVAYSLMSRCGIDAEGYYENGDFQYIFDFNTPAALYALGTAVSDLSEQVLRDVERVVKKCEREHTVSQTLAAERSNEHERSDLQPQRGLSDPRPDPGLTPGGTVGAAGQIRADAPEVSQGASGNTIQYPAAGREAVRAPDRDGAGGHEPDGTAYEGADGAEPAPGQEPRSNGLGAAYEQPAPASGGSDTHRADLQLDGETDEIPPGHEPGGISVEQLDRAGFITPADFDTLIREGAVSAAAKLDVERQIMTNPSAPELAALVVKAYEDITYTNTLPDGSHGYLRCSLPSDGDDKPGRVIFVKENDENSREKNWTWPQLQQRIVQLVEAGAYITDDERVQEEAVLERTEPEAAAPAQTEYKYYSTQRLVDIGTYPRDLVPVEIVNYDGKIPVEDGAFSAWGHLVFHEPLQPADLMDYELRPSPSNPPAQDGPDKPEPPDPDGPGGGTYSQNGNTPEPESASPVDSAPAVPAADVPAVADALAGSSITADEVDAVLRDGGNDHNTLHRIAAYFMKDKPLADNADFLRREHVARYRNVRESGKGFQFGTDKLAVWFGSEGITLGRGDTALRATDRVHLTWDQAAVRVRELLDAGEYMNGDLLDEAIGNEHRELADRLLFFYRDDLRDWRGIPEGWRTERGGWPDDVEHLKKLLDDPVEYGHVRKRLEDDVAALRTDAAAPRRFWHDPDRLLQDVQDAGIEPHAFPATDYRPPAAMRFITQDEIDSYMTRGSGFHSGKYRILSYFLQDHTAKERAAFLKKEYGHGGSSHALGGADDSWADCEPGKGIILKRGGLGDKAYDTVKLSWSAAEKRIMGLINEGRYMSRAELDHIPAYEMQALARQIQNFYYNLPADFERPYPSRGFIDDEATEAIREMLEGPDHGAGLLAAMTPIMESTPPDDRLYDTRKTAYDNLISYRAGNFHLFPGLAALPQPEAVAAPPRKLVEQVPEQLSLFSGEPAAPSVTPPPVLRGMEEQQARIEQAIVSAEPVPEPPVADTISQDEIDALLLGAVETTSQFDAILTAFAANPRSREAVQLVKDIYSDGVYLTHRIDGAEGYMGLAGDASGVTLSKNDPLTVPKEERQPAVSIDLAWPKVHRRVAELVESGRFREARDEPPTFHSPQRFLPYREGDVLAIQPPSNWWKAVAVDRVDEDVVWYTIPTEAHLGTIAMPRPKFEALLDDGQYTVMEPGAPLPPLEPAASLPDAPDRQTAVSDDTITEILVRGPGYISKINVHDQYAKNEPPEANSDFLKNQYDRLHQTVALSDGSTAYTRGSEQGLAISVQDPTRVDALLGWPEVERRVAGLIADDKYLLPSEKAMITRREKRGQEQAAADTPETAGSLTEDAAQNPATDEAGDRALAEKLLLDLQGTRNDPILFFNDNYASGMDTDRAAVIRGILHRAWEDDKRSQRQLPEDQRMPSPLPVTSRAWESAEPSHKFDIEGDRYLLLMRHRYAEHQPVVIDDENGFELRRFHYQTNDERTGHVLAYCAQEAGLLIPTDDYVITFVEPIAGENEPDRAASAPDSAGQDGHEADTGAGAPSASPEPVFFVNWEAAQRDFDLRRYDDGDVIGYDKDGVKYEVGRSSSLTYVTSTGMVWGGNSVPGNIYEQINAYLDGSLTDEQVRENYLKVLSGSHTEPQTAAIPDPAQTGQDAEQQIPRMYAVGDTVYMDGGTYTISAIGDRVNLDLIEGQNAGTLPSKQSTSRKNFEDSLTADPRNRHFAEYLTNFRSADLDAIDYSDLIDVLENGLLAPEHKEAITELIAAGGAANEHLANYLSNTFPREAETMTLETGDAADFFTTPHDISIEIQDKYGTKRGYSWNEVATVVRAIDARGWQEAEIAAIVESQPEQPAPPLQYAQGDTVYLDNDRECVIEWVGHDQVSLHDTSQPAMISQLMDKEDFEQKLRENPRNAFLLGQPAPQPEQADEPDFDTVAQTVLARVMQDENYLADLAAAPSRASLRNPCTWALEQAIRNHEQDEPASFHKYFYDDDWNDRLFGYVLRESFANRPQPQIEPSTIQHEQDTIPDEEPEDDFSDIDPVAIREALENPTPEDEARLDAMLAYAVQAAAEYDAALGIKRETPVRTEQEIIDDALREWNGVIDSKALVYQYMRERGRERDTAAFLQGEFAEYAEGVTDNSVFHIPMPDGEAQRLPWPKVQRRIAQLIEQGAFLTPDELAYVEREYDFTDPYAYDGPTAEELIRSDIQDRMDLLDPEDMEEPVWQETGGGETTRVMFDLMPETAEPSGASEPSPVQPDGGSQPVETPLPPARNYRITDDNLGAGGPKTRFAANIAAIRTLKQIEDEGRKATQPEQEILARYVGWGGLADAFDDGVESWQKEYAELKGLLTPDEYDKARASVLNAHYTPPVVVKAIYDAIGQMGFKRGNVLEPSCGTGNFFGLVPEEMRAAKLYGVELDDISARIADKLYPSATIVNSGFEKTNFPDSFFDVVIGNVPFGDYKAYDQDYNRHNFFIHDYFIAKSIDKVRAGGVVALVTSNGVSGGTFDKRDSKARRYMAERCDLIGAIRLPDNTFKAAAGTDMNTDILFLQKRDVPRDLSTDMPDWVGVSVVHEHQHEQDNGEIRNNVLTLNNYYQQHPEMVLGNLEVESGPFGPQLSCKPKEGQQLPDQLREAVSRLQADITVVEPELDELADAVDSAIPADPNVKNFSYTLVDDRVYFRENSLMYPVELPATTLDRIRGMVELRDCVHKLIDLQLNDYADFAIREQQQRLDAMYDAFTAEFGLINSVANSRAFSGDSAYYLLCSLEILDEDGNLERKADMFTKRTIKQKQVITSVDTASEALAVSIGERARVDLEYMSELSGLTREQLIEDLRGVIFLNVGGAQTQDKTYVTADEYLSGNIREKLVSARAAAAVNPALAVNVEALEKAMPRDLEASEIAVRLGSTWIDKSIYQQFMYELLKSPSNIRNIAKINYSALTGEWQVTGKGRIPFSNIAAFVTYGTERRNAYEIIEDTLNLRDVRVYDNKTENGKDIRVLNKKETTLAQQKQEQIKQAFKDWVWNDPQRRQHLVRLYNDLFNSNRVREYDGSHIVFSGMNPEFSMRPYQANAIARALYGGNTLLAHEVGAGKTFEMVAAAMEGKRLGLCTKSMFAVPNHIIDQIASDFLRLYPSANILVAQKKDFEKRNRKKFCAKIATGDYDAVIIGHSQLEKIPISAERQERLLQEQLWEVLEGIDEVKRSKGERFTVKQLERTKKRLEARLEKIREGKGRDDVVTFEQLGVDRLFVDEAHNYKNLFLYTKMRNVAGLSTTEAQKSNDLFLKCRYMDELTDGKGVIFATGTPVSNSMTELYTMQRYLQYDNLERKNLIHFDSWASIFGETVTAMELAPEGTGYRARTRFSRFHNLPELMGMFGETADIKTADTLDLKRPNAHYETVVVQPSELQQEMVQALSERAAEVHTGRVDPKEDNMLKITSDGRKIGLDQRLIDPMLPDFEGSKVNACMNNIHRIWDETKTDRLAQLVFCDFSTPNKDGRFNVYDDIKEKLIAKGIPEHEIAFIHDANTDAKKKELFAKVRKGQVRVLFGSTFKMGAGTNVQDKLIAMHDLDCPWRPADLEQRAGRIVRFGNQNPDVYIYRYVTEGTFDAYLWQTVENKQKFISQIMTSKSPVRSCEDVDETALSYAEIKALCSGNPLIKEKIDLDIEVARLRLLKSEHQSQHHRLEDDLLGSFPKNIKIAQENIAGLERDMARLEANTPKEPPAPAEPEPVAAEPGAEGSAEAEAKPLAVKAPFPPMTVLGTTYTEKAAGDALLEACKSVKDGEPVPVGSYMGFDISVSFDSLHKKFRLTLKGDMSYSVDMGVDPMGNLTRMNNALKVEMPERLQSNRTHLENLQQQMEAAKVELTKPFAMEQELAEKEMRLALVNAELNIEDGPAPMEAAVMMGEAASAKGKPSILDDLRTRTETSAIAPRHEKSAGSEILM